MKRPLFFASVIITAMVYLYLEFFLSDYLSDYSEKDGSQIQIVGMVDRKEFRVDYLGELSPVIYLIPLQETETLGKNKYIQCYMSKEDYVEPRIGEHIIVSGTIASFSSGRNPGEFDSRLYYSTLKIAYRIKNAKVVKKAGNENFFYERLYRIRYRFEEVLDKNLDSQDASIMKAVLLGDKAFMDEEVKKLYKDAGIIHILAVSGLHISIIGMGIYKLLKKLRLNTIPRTIIPVVLMYVYGQMCGMSSSAARAIVMFGISLLGKAIGRAYDLLSSLALVEIFLLIEQPLYLYNSGFLFSFGAIVGIGFVMPAIRGFMPVNNKVILRFADDKREGVISKIKNYVISGFIAGVSILLATLPVYMSFYYVYPIQSLFLNLLVLPLMAPLMIIGIVTVAFGTAFNADLILPGALIHLILKWYSLLCEFFNSLNVGKLYLGHASKGKILIYVVGLISFVLIADKVKKEWARKAGLIAALVSLCILVYSPRPELSMTFLDVGQGDGIVIRTRHENYLVDGGSTDKRNIGKYTLIPYLYYEGIGSLDAVIVTHEDEDHISGVFEMMDDMEKGGISIKNLVLPDVSVSCRGENYKKLEERAAFLGIPVSYISCGEGVKSSVEITCLNPAEGMYVSSPNAYSTALYLKYGAFTALLTGDIENEGEEHLLKDIRNSAELSKGITLLKVAHHGSKNSSGRDLLKKLSPEAAIISCGINNRYGHPHRELLDRLSETNARVYRTDEMGAIKVTVSKKKYRIETFIR